MKKFTFLFALLLVICLTGFAQDRAKPAPNARTKAYQITRLMSDQLRLNESEYIRLRTLNEERMMLAEEAAVKYKNDLEQKDLKLKEIEESFERQVLAMLSARQLEAYFTFKQNPPVTYTAFMNEESSATKK